MAYGVAGGFGGALDMDRGMEDFSAPGEDGESLLGGNETPIFSTRPVNLEHFNVASSQQRMVAVAAANCSVLTGFQNGEVVRWFSAEDETSFIDFGKEKCTDVSRVILEPKGFHALITSNTGDTWYLNFVSNMAKALPKLKGHLVEAVSWDPDSTSTSTKDLIIGTGGPNGGQLLHVVIEGKEKVVKPCYVFDCGEGRKIPIDGVHRERMVYAPDGSERIVLFVAAGCGLYGFVGKDIETLFQGYPREGASSRALVYEVPRDSVRGGELHMDTACVGPSSTKVLFWLTGVGVLAADIKSPIEADNAVLESPPGLIPFPRSPKAPALPTSSASLIAGLLPPEPPAAPTSMALTRYHVVFLFDDRWAVVSRVNHEVVQQQEWASSTYGSLKSLARDVHGEGLWMCSEKHMFEICPENEDRNVWALLLRLEHFEEALNACKQASQRPYVLAAHADWLFRKGRFVESARKFAEVTTSFEHVALRFLRVDQKAALLEYFRCRFKQCKPDDRVTRALLGVWAVEISLAHLNNLRVVADEDSRKTVGEGKVVSSKERSVHSVALEEARSTLRELLRDCKDLDVHTTIYHLLQSHGWLEELVYFAEERRDFDTVILHRMSRCDYASAIKNLEKFQEKAGANVGRLVVRYAPVLFGAEPQSFVSMLLRKEFSSVDPLAVLPALYTPTATAAHRSEVVRYLEHVMRHNPELVGHVTEGEGAPVRRAAALGDDKDILSGVGNVGEDGALVPIGRSWATGSAVLNVLTVLYTSAPEGEDKYSHPDEDAEKLLLSFFGAQEGNPLFDPQFALRVCVERRLMRAAVLLYGLMGMHEEAVCAALGRGDVALAKHNACRPAERPHRQKLWLRIVKHVAETGDVQAITGLIHESQELTVRDVLPHMSDSISIDAFQAEICECLDTYEGQIQTLRQEMDDHRRALNAFKKDLKQAEERCVTIAEDQVCEICGAPAIRERFYVFACRHCFHEACLRALVCPTLGQDQLDRLFKLEAKRIEYQAAAAGAAMGGAQRTSDTSLAEVEDELDGILADDCPLCGRLMIQTIRRPFIDLPTEQAQADSWAIA